MQLFYKTTDREFIDTLYGLFEEDSARRRKVLEAFGPLGVRQVLLSVKTTTVSAATVGPRMIGIPTPADPNQDTLPGWRRIQDPRVAEDYLVPVDGPDGDEARQFLEDHKPTDIRGVLLTKYGIPRCVYTRSTERRVHPDGLWPLGFVCSPEAVWVCYGAEPYRDEDRMPEGLFTLTDVAEGLAAGERYGWGWQVSPRCADGTQPG
jgi:hypothetical protein